MKIAEVYILLDFIAMIEQKGWHAENGSLTIVIDNKKVYGMIHEAIDIPSKFTQNTVVQVMQILTLVDKIKFNINF